MGTSRKKSISSIRNHIKKYCNNPELIPSNSCAIIVAAARTRAISMEDGTAISLKLLVSALSSH